MGNPIRLNVGCGGRRYPGYTGVDAVARSGADVIAQADKLPFEDGQVEEVMAIHLIEHVHEWEVKPTLQEWFRVLRPGGKLVIEAPDVVKCCKNLVDNVMRGGKHPWQLSYFGLWGDPREKDSFMAHKWGWTFNTLKDVAESVGFVKLKEFPTQFHPAGRNCRDFRLEAMKPDCA